MKKLQFISHITDNKKSQKRERMKEKRKKNVNKLFLNF